MNVNADPGRVRLTSAQAPKPVAGWRCRLPGDQRVPRAHSAEERV